MFQIRAIKKAQGQTACRPPSQCCCWPIPTCWPEWFHKQEKTKNMRSARDLSRDMIFSAMFNFNARRCFAWREKEIWLSDRPSLDPNVIPEDIVETLASRMPLTHLVDQRPHHLPQTNGTNVTIGQDTYTVLGEYFLKRNHQTGELQAGQQIKHPLTASNKHMCSKFEMETTKS